MARPYDDTLKKLIRVDPQAFVNWLIPAALLIGMRSEALKYLAREVDALLEVLVNGQRMLLHIEFQSSNDATMAERLLRYNVLARMEYKLPVISCVIYLFKDGEVAQSPLRWSVPTGQEVLEFHFHNIELGKLSPEDILRTEQPGLLPLLPLTEGGARRDVVTRMLTELGGDENRDLALIGYTLASLVFNRENKVDQDWLIRRFHEMHDILRETPIYQEILKEGLEEGLERGLQKGLEQGLQKGREQGRQEGRLEALRQMLLNIVQSRFPNSKLPRIAKGQAAIIEDSETLQDLILKVSQAQTPEEAQEYLLS